MTVLAAIVVRGVGGALLSFNRVSGIRDFALDME